MRLVIVSDADKRRIEINVSEEIKMSTLIMVAAKRLSVIDSFSNIVLRKEDMHFATKEERTLEELNINDGDTLTLSGAVNSLCTKQLNHLIGSMRVSANKKVYSRNIKLARHAKTLFENLSNERVCNTVNRHFPQLATTYLAHPKDLGLFITTFADKFESIRKSREEILNRSVEKAVAEFPECFKKTPMLYLKAHLNGTEILALVDTGAQSSIISTTAVEKCNVAHLVDDRFCIFASGVGGMESSLGRILACDLFVSNTKLICSFDVLPNDACNVDLIIGLDVLSKNQAVLDLMARKIRFKKGEFLSFISMEEAEAVAPFEKRKQHN
ncbi:unnamed protein product [Cylicocyclus nassatus]|uniref:Peptidase A2 domain-containing protein n=1 Tax=Cylicocyclus nassatus TaxID=53992 RepID=A0AA36M933_CYLNA|nr:unnamed protein product [Cylicocyclus nassatus]